jgi:hypothetical protein
MVLAGILSIRPKLTHGCLFIVRSQSSNPAPPRIVQLHLKRRQRVNLRDGLAGVALPWWCGAAAASAPPCLCFARRRRTQSAVAAQVLGHQRTAGCRADELDAGATNSTATAALFSWHNSRPGRARRFSCWSPPSGTGLGALPAQRVGQAGAGGAVAVHRRSAWGGRGVWRFIALTKRSLLLTRFHCRSGAASSVFSHCSCAEPSRYPRTGSGQTSQPVGFSTCFRPAGYKPRVRGTGVNRL